MPDNEPMFIALPRRGHGGTLHVINSGQLAPRPKLMLPSTPTLIGLAPFWLYLPPQFCSNASKLLTSRVQPKCTLSSTTSP